MQNAVPQVLEKLFFTIALFLPFPNYSSIINSSNYKITLTLLLCTGREKIAKLLKQCNNFFKKVFKKKG